MEIIKKYGLYIVGGVTIVVITLVLVNKAVNRYEDLVATENSYKTLINQVKENEKVNNIKDNISNINLSSVDNTIDILNKENNNKLIINNIINKADGQTEIKPEVKVIKTVDKEIEIPKKSIKNNKALVINTLRELSNSIDPQIESLPNI